MLVVSYYCYGCKVSIFRVNLAFKKCGKMSYVFIASNTIGKNINFNSPFQNSKISSAKAVTK